MPVCALQPADKKKLISQVGEELVKKHGKRDYYKPSWVKRAAEKWHYPIDVHCWAYCIFTTPQDFTAIHAASGEICDYNAMKAEVLTELSGGQSFLWEDIDLSWLKWPDIDLSSIFDWFDIG